MRVISRRCLAEAETVDFALEIAGHARVFRAQRRHVYVLSVGRQRERMSRSLHVLALNAS